MRFDWILLNLGILSIFLINYSIYQFSALNRGTFESSGIGLAVKCLYQFVNIVLFYQVNSLMMSFIKLFYFVKDATKDEECNTS